MESESRFGMVHLLLTLAAGGVGYVLVHFPHLLSVHFRFSSGDWAQYWPLAFVFVCAFAVLVLLVGGWASLVTDHLPRRRRAGFSDDELVRMDEEMKAVRRRAGLPV